MKIGVMYGNPETTTGGQALKFYASVRMEIRRVESIKQGTDISGNRVRVKVVKNKVAPPFRNAEFDIMFNEGISRIGSLVDLGTEMASSASRARSTRYGDQRLGQGRENVKEFLRDTRKWPTKLKAQIRATMAEKGAATISIGTTTKAQRAAANAVAEDGEEAEF